MWLKASVLCCLWMKVMVPPKVERRRCLPPMVDRNCAANGYKACCRCLKAMVPSMLEGSGTCCLTLVWLEAAVPRIISQHEGTLFWCVPPYFRCFSVERISCVFVAALPLPGKWQIRPCIHLTAIFDRARRALQAPLLLYSVPWRI